LWRGGFSKKKGELSGGNLRGELKEKTRPGGYKKTTACMQNTKRKKKPKQRIWGEKTKGRKEFKGKNHYRLINNERCGDAGGGARSLNPGKGGPVGENERFKIN